MPSDEDEFDRLMRQAGVVRLGDRRTVRERKVQAEQRQRVEEQSAEEEFRAAMQSLDSVPDKDAWKKPAQPVPGRVQRLTFPRRASLHFDGTLDLHGMREAEAINRLGLFVRNAVVHGMRRVLVVTGKGHHSMAGRAVLRPAVEAWILGEGMPWVAGFGESPRRNGGAGALVLDLRKPTDSAD